MIATLVFTRTSGAQVKVSAAPLAVMHGLRQRPLSRDLEAGGVLLGRYLLGTADVVIDQVTVPMRGDRQTRTQFHRDRRRHQQVIDGCWADSRGTCQYLGEWHTHPEATPSPSRTDLGDWRRRLKRDGVDTDALLFLIVGTERLLMWEGVRSSLEIRQLQLVKQENWRAGE